MLLDAQALELSPEDYEKHLSHLRKVARQDGLDYIFQKYGVDLILGSSDTSLTSYATGSGEFIPSQALTTLIVRRY